MKKTVMLALAFAAAISCSADGLVKPRVATPSKGMTPGDPIVYSIDATEWGADRTGATDSSGAIQKALNELNKRNGGTLFLPAGRYRLDKPVNVEGGVSMRGEWRHPGEGGPVAGTVICVYGGRGDTNAVKNAAVKVRSGACVRDLAFWYPEQTLDDPAPYPATVWGDGHTTVFNVTFVNSWIGFYNNHCSSMLVRHMYGTALSVGLHGAYAFDIPRIEHFALDPAYWAKSALPGAPAPAKLAAYLDANLTGIVAGEQDWGYWWDVSVNHARAAVQITAVLDDAGKRYATGNIGAGKLKVRNADIGVEMINVGYPGFMLTYGDIEARKACMYYAPLPDYQSFCKPAGIKWYKSDNAAVMVTGVRFAGAGHLFLSEKEGKNFCYCINFNDCVFERWGEAAVKLPLGSLTASNCAFRDAKPALDMAPGVSQVVLNACTFGGAPFVKAPAETTFVARDDKERSTKRQRYDFKYEVDERVAPDRLFDVTDFGAVAGTLEKYPEADSTPAFRKAIAAAAAAGGGIVYAPAGAYRMDGGVAVPTGVELRGSFQGQHYGNSTHRGSVLLAYGGKDDEKGDPLVTLGRRAAVTGFTVFYPEQGCSDAEADLADETLRIKKYPPTVRTAPGCQVRNMTINACWTAIDALSVRSDGLVISDVTGAAMWATLVLGHGTDGGVVRDMHFNYSSWNAQGKFANHPRGGDWDKSTTLGKMADYTTRVTKGIILHDAKNVDFFSCFNIIVAEQIVLEKDPYTGGDFKGIMWGVAFDAATNGIIGRPGSSGKLAIICSMGVFCRQDGGYYIKTEPGFKGVVALLNADIWSGRSRLVYLEGGTAILSQFLSWCCYEGVVKSGATLHVTGSSLASNNGNDKGEKVEFTFEPGSSGSIRGTLDGRRFLRIVDQTGGSLVKNNNGVEVN